MLMTALMALLSVPALHAEQPAPVPAPVITALCDDNFESAIVGLGSAAGLVLFVATEYNLSKRQLEIFKAFSTQRPADEVKFFTVEVNQCSKVVVSQQIRRVPSVVLYQEGGKLGELSSLSDPISADQLTELVGKMR
ncbi:MAG: thioredoxin-like negative regulator of GroEL [Myxococcota bacterium]|jgi:thioredoxin-like negative regulator of GroEL